MPLQQQQPGNIPAVGDRAEPLADKKGSGFLLQRAAGSREMGLGNLTPFGRAALACCSVSCSAVPEREERLMSAVGYCHFLLFPQLSGRCL